MTRNAETPSGVLSDESALIAEKAALEPGIPEIVRLMESAGASYASACAFEACQTYDEGIVEFTATAQTNTLYRI